MYKSSHTKSARFRSTPRSLRQFLELLQFRGLVQLLGPVDHLLQPLLQVVDRLPFPHLGQHLLELFDQPVHAGQAVGDSVAWVLDLLLAESVQADPLVDFRVGGLVDRLQGGHDAAINSVE